MQDALTRLIESVGEADDLEKLTRPMLELLESVTGLESTYLTMIDQVAGLQRILYARNSRKMQIPEGLSVPWGDTLCKRALEEGRMYTADVAACWGDSEAARALGIMTYLSQPVRTFDGDVFGTLCAASGSSVQLQPITMEVLARFARLIAQQVDREHAIRQLQASNNELSSYAMTDPLTGLANRRGMEREVKRMLAKGERDEEPLCVALIDLDGFKAINDRYGHDVGDLFLVHIARKLSAAVRAGDLVSRVGGDEFVVLAPGEAEGELRRRLGDATVGRFSCSSSAIDYAGASVGVAQLGSGGADITLALKQADVDMYQVKRERKAARV